MFFLKIFTKKKKQDDNHPALFQKRINVYALFHQYFIHAYVIFCSYFKEINSACKF